MAKNPLLDIKILAISKTYLPTQTILDRALQVVFYGWSDWDLRSLSHGHLERWARGSTYITKISLFFIISSAVFTMKKYFPCYKITSPYKNYWDAVASVVKGRWSLNSGSLLYLHLDPCKVHWIKLSIEQTYFK